MILTRYNQAMTYHAVIHALDLALPDEQIRRDMTTLLAEDADNGTVTISFDDDDKELVCIPLDAPIEMVTKAFFKEYVAGVGFGVYRVLVAVGGFHRDEQGFHCATHCFATLYYNIDGELITHDLHREFR